MWPASTVTECGDRVAAEIERLLESGCAVRDPETGEHRPIAARDVGILFRTKESHQEFEKALERVGIASYVYKGLGFFDADEIMDVMAMIFFLGRSEHFRAATGRRGRAPPY